MSFMFIPPLLPLSQEDDSWGAFGSLPSRAASALGHFSGMVNATAKADIFWLMWLLQESQYSNEIEGTVTTLDEVLEEHAGLQIPVDRREDVQEVVNYRDTMQSGGDAIISGEPFSLTFVRALHAKLLNGSRGQDKHPGMYRTVHVHIGRPGRSVKEASYIPPVPEHLPDLLENWISFVHRTDMDPLIQAAIMHAQFEMIHPFLDGNGRMGRLMISLFFMAKNFLTRPCFYMSAYLHEHRDTYYSCLGGISNHGNWHTWIEFFLTAIIERSHANITILQNMTELYESIKHKLPDITSSGRAIALLDYAFAHPIFTVPKMATSLNQSVPTITPLVKKLHNANIFQQLKQGSGRQAGVWKFGQLIELLQH